VSLNGGIWRQARCLSYEKGRVLRNAAFAV
jgi:hypothetical protein